MGVYLPSSGLKAWNEGLVGVGWFRKDLTARVRVATITDMTTQKGTPMTTTNSHLYICDCGCAETIAVEFVGGFAGTTCKVQPCSKRSKIGAVAFDIPRSAALSMQPASAYKTIAHAEGLVTFA